METNANPAMDQMTKNGELSAHESFWTSYEENKQAPFIIRGSNEFIKAFMMNDIIAKAM